MKKIILLLVVGVASFLTLTEGKNATRNFVTASETCQRVSLPGREWEVSDDFKDVFSSYYLRTTSFLNESQCKDDLNSVLIEARKLNMWALKILDASAKLPSGIISGNLNQFGDYDECISSKGDFQGHSIKGKYCLINVDIKAQDLRDEKLRALDDAIHAHRVITNELSDQGHRIPKIETFVWGLCIPSSCSREQVEDAVRHHLNGVSKGTPFRFDVSVSEELCYEQQDKPFSMAKLMVICLFLLILALTIFDLITDVDKFLGTTSKAAAILKCFSLRKNWAALTRTSVSDDDIDCLHGGRFLNAVGLLLSHKQIAMMYTPTFNRTAMGEAFSRTWTMLGRSAILYTDTFIMFSGILASYSYVKTLDEKKSLGFKDKLINRIFRFTPNLLATILFCTYIMNDMSSGPQWGLVVTKYSNLCKENMWTNFLYIHNYFGFENMCLTHTHQLGIDMQLFLVSPIFVYFLWKSPKFGSTILLVVSIASTWLRYDVTQKEKLSTLIYYGISVEKLWKTANMSYILPTHRLTVYLSGILVGYYLRRNGRKFNFNYFVVAVGWFLAVASALFAMFGSYKAAFKGYEYDPRDAAMFNALAPILWVVFLTWTILACVNGYGGLFNNFLEWKYFKIFTRISYGVYLTQFPVFFYGIGTERTVQYYKGFHSLFDIPELFVILAASIVLTLTFDLPFQELKKLLTKGSPPQNGENKMGDSSLVRRNEVECSMNRLKTHKIRRRLNFYGT